MDTQSPPTPEQQVHHQMPNNGTTPNAAPQAHAAQTTPFHQQQSRTTQQVAGGLAAFMDIMQLSLVRGDAMYADLEQLKAQQQMIVNAVRTNTFNPLTPNQEAGNNNKLFADIVNLSKKISSLEVEVKEKTIELSKIKVIVEQLESKLTKLEQGNVEKERKRNGNKNSSQTDNAVPASSKKD